MKVRFIKSHEVEGTSDSLNMHGLGEVVVWFRDGSADSCLASELDVWLEASSRWVPLSEAFRRHDVITDTRVSRFFEPPTAEDRARGYTTD